MTTRQINNFKPEDVISWNTGRPYDELGQTISAWRDPELVRKGFTATIFFVDGSRGISEVIDWDNDDAPRQDRRVSLQDHVMRIYDMDTVSRRAMTDEEWIILDLINEVNQEYRKSLKG